MRKHSIPTLLLALATLPMSAAAVPVTYEFAGNLYPGTSLPEWFEPEFPGGTSFTGSFTVDSAIMPTAGDANSAFFDGGILDLQLSFGANGSLGGFTQSDYPLYQEFPYTSSAYFLNDWASNGGPPIFYYDLVSLSVYLQAAPGDSPYLKRWFGLSAFSFDGTMFAGLPSLPDFPLPTTDSWSMRFGATLYDSSGAEVGTGSYGGTLTEMRRSVSVPEPATWGMLLAGIVGAAALRRPRRAQA